MGVRKKRVSGPAFDWACEKKRVKSMRWVVEIVYVLGRMRRARAAQDLEDELRAHLEREIEDNLEAGMSPAEARRAAHLAFGNISLVKEDSRKMWGLSFVEILWQDLRYGVRMLLASPGPTAVAIAALALGIGANTAVFSAVYGVLLKPLPFPRPDRLVAVESINARSSGKIWGGVSPADFTDFRAAARAFDGVTAERGTGVTMDFGGYPEMFPAESVSDDFFKVFAVEPLLGRTFTADEFTSAAAPAVVLSYRLWRDRLGAEARIVGSSMTVDGKPATIVGVMPPGFVQPEYALAWVPLARDSSELQLRGARYFHITGLLKDHTTTEQGQAEMTAIAGRLEQQYPDSDKDWGVRIAPLKEEQVGKFRTALLVLLSAVGLVLLTACANVANLQLARAASRRREIAVREALGAPRNRIIRQLLTESTMLSAIGAAIGLALSYWAIAAITTLVPKSIGLPRLSEVHVDAAALLFTSTVALLTGILFGLAPALHTSRPDLQSTLKEGGRTVAGSRGLRRARGMLIVAEMALTLMLLAGAGLLLRSFLELQSTSPGFNPRNLITTSVPVDFTRYREEGKRSLFYQSILQQVESMPGVQSAALNSSIPLGFYLGMGFRVQGRVAAPGDAPQASYSSISASYFKTMQVPLIAGREFTDQDNQQSPRVAIINEAMQQSFFPGEDPVGQSLVVNNLDRQIPVQIVGVVADVKQTTLKDGSGVEIYVPCMQTPWLSSWLFVRSAGETASVSGAVQHILWDLNRNKALPETKLMTDILGESVAEARFYAWMLGGLALIALGLAAIGVYGIISHSVAERTHEIGVKMALGAGFSRIMTQVIGQSAALGAIGIAVGLAGAFAVTRLLSTLLYGVSSTDALTFVTISVVLAAVALIAGLAPARKAARVDPVVALRGE
jgi:predicted permease